jgi:hypothetical protein
VTQLAHTSNEDGSRFRHQWYRLEAPQLEQFLDMIMEDPRGRSKIRTWMKPNAIELIHDNIEEEMVKVQKHLYFPSIESITPSFIRSWSNDTIIEPAVDHFEYTSMLVRQVNVLQCRTLPSTDHSHLGCQS